MARLVVTFWEEGRVQIYIVPVREFRFARHAAFPMAAFEMRKGVFAPEYLSSMDTATEFLYLSANGSHRSPDVCLFTSIDFTSSLPLHTDDLSGGQFISIQHFEPDCSCHVTPEYIMSTQATEAWTSYYS
jgi:hypothetical protein